VREISQKVARELTVKKRLGVRPLGKRRSQTGSRIPMKIRKLRGLDRWYHAAGIRPGAARLRSASGGLMTAIVYFGEMLVASLLAMVLFAVS
jgi:hypothetical protein